MAASRARGSGLQDSPIVGIYILGVAFVMAWHTVTPLIPLYAASLGASALGVGAVVGASTIFPFVLGIHLGAASDRYGPGRLARVMSLLFAAAFAFLVLGRGLPAVALAVAVLGLADLGLAIVTQAYVGSVGRPDERYRNFGYFSLWMSLGALLGPIVGGAVADRLGFHAAFGVGLVLAVAAAVISWTLLASGRRPAAMPRRPVLGLAADMLREPQTRGVLMVNFAGVFAFSLRQSFYPLYLTSIGLPITLVGVLISTQALCSMMSRPVLGAVTARFGSTRVLTAAMTFTSIGVASTVLFRAFWPLAVTIGLTGIGMGLLAPLSMSLIAGRAGPGAQGVAAGLRVSAMQFAQLASPLLCGVAAAMFGLSAPFALGAAVAAGGLVPVMMLRSRRRVSALAETPSTEPALLDDIDTRVAAERSGQRGGHRSGDGR